MNEIYIVSELINGKEHITRLPKKEAQVLYEKCRKINENVIAYKEYIDITLELLSAITNKKVCCFKIDEEKESVSVDYDNNGMINQQVLTIKHINNIVKEFLYMPRGDEKC